MYKIIIVDDESEVRDGIMESIEWESHGFFCIGGYANGSDALEAIEEHKPDLVLSDICMPFMDGIELTEQIRMRFPYVKVIIITGYDDFDYAQRALRLKVSDFILKPITANELRILLDKVRAEMDEEREHREDLNRLRLQLQQSFPLLKERFLEQLIYGTLNELKIVEKFKYFRLSQVSPPFLVLAIDIDDLDGAAKARWDNDPELVRSEAFNIVQDAMEGSIVFRTREERIVVIIAGEPEESIVDTAFQGAEMIRYCIEKYMGLTVTAGIGTPCGELSELSYSYKGAASALDYRLLLGNNRVIGIQDMEGMQGSDYRLDMEWNRKFFTLIKTGTVQEAEALMKEFILCLKASLMPIGSCYLQIQSILITIINTAQEWGSAKNSLALDHSRISDGIRKFQTLDELEWWLRDICQTALSHIAEQRSDLTKMQVMSVIDYIEEHYHDENLSLQHLCRHVHLSKSYLSSIFKQHTEQTLMEYVTRIRIDKAKDLLLNTHMKFYEIAEKVGYHDPQYFSVLFKKHVGTTLTEFRDKSVRVKPE